MVVIWLVVSAIDRKNGGGAASIFTTAVSANDGDGGGGRQWTPAGRPASPLSARSSILLFSFVLTTAARLAAVVCSLTLYPIRHE